MGWGGGQVWVPSGLGCLPIGWAAEEFFCGLRPGAAHAPPNPDHKRRGRHADPLGATESRGLQAAAVVKQNDFLKGYIASPQLQVAVNERGKAKFLPA